MHGQSWHKATLIGLLSGVILLLALMTLTSSAVFRTYQNDVASNAEECVDESAAKDYKKSKECQGILYRTLDDPVALLTGILDLATLALFFATYLLFVAAVRQGGDAKEALDAARISASAALASATLAEKALEGVETPYLYPVLTTNNPTFAHGFARLDNVNIVVAVQFKNFGRSPAICEYISATLHVGPGLPKPNDDIQSSYMKKTEIIDAGATSSPLNLGIGYGAISDVDSSGNRIATLLYIVGSCLCSDVFGNRFIFSMCYFFNHRTQAFYAMGGPRHNGRRKLSREECAAIDARNMNG